MQDMKLEPRVRKATMEGSQGASGSIVGMRCTSVHVCSRMALQLSSAEEMGKGPQSQVAELAVNKSLVLGLGHSSDIE